MNEWMNESMNNVWGFVVELVSWWRVYGGNGGLLEGLWWIWRVVGGFMVEMGCCWRVYGGNGGLLWFIRCILRECMTNKSYLLKRGYDSKLNYLTEKVSSRGFCCCWRRGAIVCCVRALQPPVLIHVGRALAACTCSQVARNRLMSFIKNTILFFQIINKHSNWCCSLHYMKA